MIVTNLLGRRVKLYSGGKNTVVAVYVDRGMLVFVVENSGGGLRTTDMQSFNLMPEEEPTATPAMTGSGQITGDARCALGQIKGCLGGTQVAAVDGVSCHETGED